MRSLWRIELLGDLQAKSDHQILTRFSTRQTATLLAYLALFSRRAHSRDELAELLWPETDPDQARPRLRQALTTLRRLLEPPGIAAGSVLITDRNFVRLNRDAFSTDVAEFEEAVRRGQGARARALYRGDLLPGFYDDWVVMERERLRARLLEADDFPGELELSEIQAEPNVSSDVRLPPTPKPMFGRGEEKAHLAALLTELRLITLTGPGGTGKTRLAIEAARRYAGAANVRFIGLAEVAYGENLAGILAERLFQSDSESETAQEKLVRFLSETPALLILDNLEHLIEYAAPLVSMLLSKVSTLKILVTSRRPLHVFGEREFAVPALPTPLSESTFDQITACPSVQLFVDRAREGRPDFALTPRNAATIATICRYLEGSPLALELMATRASTLSLTQMASLLPQRFALLATSRKDWDVRHRSLWTTISWSIDLLPERLRQFWTALSIFQGSFSVDAAAEVTREAAALAALTQLKDHSLVISETSDMATRFRLAEPLREFARESLTPEEWKRLRGRHLNWYASWVEELRPKLRGIQQERLLKQLAAEAENMTAALGWSLEPDGDARVGLQLAANLGKYWSLRGNNATTIPLLETLLSHIDNQQPNVYRCRALVELGHLAYFWQNDRSRARSLYETVLEEGRQCDAGSLPATALHMLSSLAYDEGDLATARCLCEQALTEYERHNFVEGIATTRASLGIFAAEAGDFDQARDALEQAIQIQIELGNLSGIAHFRREVALIYLRLAEPQKAQVSYRESLDAYVALGDTRGLATLLNDLALNLPPTEESIRLLGAAQALQQNIGATVSLLPDDPRLETHRTALTEKAFLVFWRDGMSRPLPSILEDAGHLLTCNYQAAVMS